MMRTNKYLSLILVMVLALVIAMPATASAANGSIEISSNKVAGQTFYAYRIFTVETNAESNAGVADSFVYTLNPAYTAFQTSYAPKMLPTTTLKDYVLGLIDPVTGRLAPARQNDLDNLARALWNWSDANRAALTSAGAFATATGTATGVTFPNLPAGYYVVAGTGLFGTSPATSFAALCTVIDNTTSAVVLKADAPSIKKEVLNHHNNAWEKWTDVGVTGQVQFKLTSTISDTTHYLHYTYRVHDEMSAGLTYNSIASVIAYKGAAFETLNLVTLENANGYRLSGPSTDTNGITTFTVTVNSNTIMRLSEAGFDRIEIIYNATLNNFAVVERNGNPNYVKLEYSNDPNWEGVGTPPTDETPKDDAWVYTYRLDILKFTGDEDPAKGTVLPGVIFQLFNSSGQVAQFQHRVSLSPYIETYLFQGWAANVSPAADNTKLTTGPDGMVQILGVDEGSYVLREFKQLKGYNPIPDMPFTLYNRLLDEVAGNTMSALITRLNTDRGKPDTGVSKLKYAGFVAGVYQIDVYNGKGAIFPGTGGIGVYAFYATGALITAGLITFFVVRRKRDILKVR